jgi:hypothetical protein
MSAALILMNASRRPSSPGSSGGGCLGCLLTLIALAIGVGGILYIELTR